MIKNNEINRSVGKEVFEKVFKEDIDPAAYVEMCIRDSYAAGQMATRHLIDKGCQHILCIRGNSKLKMPDVYKRQAKGKRASVIKGSNGIQDRSDRR